MQFTMHFFKSTDKLSITIIVADSRWFQQHGIGGFGVFGQVCSAKRDKMSQSHGTDFTLQNSRCKVGKTPSVVIDMIGRLRLLELQSSKMW